MGWRIAAVWWLGLLAATAGHAYYLDCERAAVPVGEAVPVKLQGREREPVELVLCRLTDDPTKPPVAWDRGWPNPGRLRPDPRALQPVLRWTVTPPEDGEPSWRVTSLVQPPCAGRYAVSDAGNVASQTSRPIEFSYTELDLVATIWAGELVALVQDHRSGTPLSGIEVTATRLDGSLTAAGRTDRTGVWRRPWAAEGRELHLCARRDDDALRLIAWEPNAPPPTASKPADRPVDQGINGFVTSDRTIYRAGDTMHVLGYAWHDFHRLTPDEVHSGKYVKRPVASAAVAVRVTVRDEDDHDPTVAEASLITDRDGRFETDLRLPADWPPGASYGLLEAEVAGESFGQPINLSSGLPSLVIQAPPSPSPADEPLTFVATATLAGEPLRETTITYNLLRRTARPGTWLRLCDTGICIEPSRGTTTRIEYSSWSSAATVRTDAQGVARITAPAGTPPGFTNTKLVARIADRANRLIEASAEARTEPFKAAVWLGLSDTVVLPGEHLEARWAAQDDQCRPAAVAGRLSLYRLRATADQGLERVAPVWTGRATSTGADGLGCVRLRAPAPGTYQVVVESGTASSAATFYCFGNGLQPPVGLDGPCLTARRSRLRDGDAAAILLRAPRANRTALICVDNGIECQPAKPVRLTGHERLLSVPVASRTTIVTALLPGSRLASDELHIGATESNRPPRLTVAVDPTGRRLTAVTRNAAGRPVPARVALAVHNDDRDAYTALTLCRAAPFPWLYEPDWSPLKSAVGWSPRLDGPPNDHRQDRLSFIAKARLMRAGENGDDAYSADDAERLRTAKETSAGLGVAIPSGSLRPDLRTLLWRTDLATDADGRLTLDVDLPPADVPWLIEAQAVFGIGDFADCWQQFSATR